MIQDQNIYISLIVPDGKQVRFDDPLENEDRTSRFHKVFNYNNSLFPPPREFRLNYNEKYLNTRKYKFDLTGSSYKELVIRSKEKVVKWHIYNASHELVISHQNQSFTSFVVMLGGLNSGQYYIEFLMDHGTIFTNCFSLHNNFLGLN